MALKLKHTIDSLTEVPLPLKDYYSKTGDGKFALDVEGGPESARVAEFRTKNIDLMKEVEELRPLKAKYEGLDPDAAKAALAKLATFDGVDPAEYHALKAKPDATKLAAELAAEKSAHATTQFKHVVTAEFLRLGGRASAIDFMAGEAAKVFGFQDGRITTKEFSAANPAEPLSIPEWMRKQISVADFAFQPSRGGGAGNTGSGELPRFGTRSNQKVLTNPTPQELGANASAIAKGDMKVEYTS